MAQSGGQSAGIWGQVRPSANSAAHFGKGPLRPVTRAFELLILASSGEYKQAFWNSDGERRGSFVDGRIIHVVSGHPRFWFDHCEKPGRGRTRRLLSGSKAQTASLSLPDCYALGSQNWGVDCAPIGDSLTAVGRLEKYVN